MAPLHIETSGNGFALEQERAMSVAGFLILIRIVGTSMRPAPMRRPALART